MCSMYPTKHHLVCIHVTRRRYVPTYRGVAQTFQSGARGVRLLHVSENAGKKMLPYQDASWRCRLLARHHIVGTAPFSTRRRCLLKGILGLTPPLQPPHFCHSHSERDCVLGHQAWGVMQVTCRTGTAGSGSPAINRIACMCSLCGMSTSSILIMNQYEDSDELRIATIVS